MRLSSIVVNEGDSSFGCAQLSSSVRPCAEVGLVPWFSSCVCSGLWFLFFNWALDSRLLPPCVWEHSEPPLGATLSSFYFPPSFRLVSPQPFAFSLTGEQLGRLTARLSVRRSSPLSLHKLIFYFLTVTRADSSFRTRLTLTVRVGLIFSQIFQRPPKCWFVL